MRQESHKFRFHVAASEVLLQTFPGNGDLRPQSISGSSGGEEEMKEGYKTQSDIFPEEFRGENVEDLRCSTSYYIDARRN